MGLSIHEQFLGAIERSNRPIIILTETADIDDFASAFSIISILSKMGKSAEIATTGGMIPKNISFLNQETSVRGDLTQIRKMTIEIDTKSAMVDELSYEEVDGKLSIHLVPKTGVWHQEDLSVKTDAYKYDLVITIGVRDLAQIGSMYTLYPDFFFTTPVVNIDHRSDNEHFGQLNIVDMNAVSCTEVCHDLFERIDGSLFDKEMATVLLTGMIFKTNSFKAQHVSPRTLSVAGSLIEKGGDRDLIVQHLYKTKTVETLRLWGRALARLKADTKHALIWTMLTKKDFVNAGAGTDALNSIVDELISTSPQSNVVAIFYEIEDRIDVLLHAVRPYDALALGAAFSATGTREEAILHIASEDIVKSEKEVISHLKQKLSELAG